MKRWFVRLLLASVIIAAAYAIYQRLSQPDDSSYYESSDERSPAAA